MKWLVRYLHYKQRKINTLGDVIYIYEIVQFIFHDKIYEKWFIMKCCITRHGILTGWLPAHGILHKGKHTSSTMLGLQAMSENLNHHFKNESSGYTNFNIPSGSRCHTDGWPRLQLYPTQKLWSFREEEIPFYTTSHEGDVSTGVKDKWKPITNKYKHKHFNIHYIIHH